MLHDGTDGIYVYGDNKSVKVGDYVEVIGGVYSYYGSLQVGSNVSVNKSNGKVTLPEYKVVTPQQWEDQNKGLGDEVIGHLGGDLYKVEGYLGYGYNETTKDEFFITDANTGEVSWIYYKSYTPEMKAELEARMNEIIDEEKLDLFMLLITDIVNSNSQVIALGSAANVVEKAYNVKLEDNTALLEGVVSRKKQVVPIMTENA